MEYDIQQPDLFGLDSEQESETPRSFAPAAPEQITVTAHEIMELPTDEIKCLDSVADYEPSRSLHSVVFWTTQGIFCGDDYGKIRDALAAGEAEIKCEMFALSGHSDLDLMLRKTGRRLTPAGGHAPFIQVAINVRACFEALKASSDDYVIYTRGGDRLSKKFNGDKENDVRVVLCERFVRDRDTLNSYLSATEFITIDKQASFFTAKPPKSFFDQIRKEKSNLVLRLQAQKQLGPKVFDTVSEGVWKSYDAYMNGDENFEKILSALPAAATMALSSGNSPSAIIKQQVKSKIKAAPKLAPKGPPPTPPANPITSDAVVMALAADLKAHGEAALAAAEKLRQVTDQDLAATFYLDIVTSKNTLTDIISRFMEHFKIGKEPVEKATS